MNVEIAGMISTRYISETHPGRGPVIDPPYLKEFAQAHEDAGFDRVLVALGSSSPDPTQVAAFVGHHTKRLKLMIAHRPGFISPTVAARQFASLDHLIGGGRTAVHIISGGDDADQRRDGDWLNKEERYERTDEYLQILTRAWQTSEPFSHHGKYYSFEDFATNVVPHGEALPIYFGGASEAALRVGGRYANTYAFWSEPLEQSAQFIKAIHNAAAAAGRADVPGVSVSFRPILGRTEEEAWARARAIRTKLESIGPRLTRSIKPTDRGSERVREAAERGERFDKAFWTGTVTPVHGLSSAASLVGTPETVADALLDYVDLGVTTLLIRGYDPLEDVVDFGRELIPRLREGLAARRSISDGKGVAVGSGPAPTEARAL